MSSELITYFDGAERHRPFGQGLLLPSVRCARLPRGAMITCVEVIGFLALFLMAFVALGSDPEARD